MKNINIIPSDDDLVPHTDFSYDIIKKRHWKEKKLSRSVFNGTVISEVVFEKIDFSYSDFEGTKFTRCSFISCSFLSTEIHSIWASDCDFSNSIFNESHITDTTFINCKFKQCSFDNLVLYESTFDSCCLSPFQPKNSSFSLNQFNSTTFCDAFFRNYFYYHIFRNCQFIESSFEAYLLGFTYGLSSQNYHELKSVFMEEKMLCPLDDLIDDVYEIYMKRKMYLNVGFLKLSHCESNADIVLIQFVDLLDRFLRENLLLKVEQIKYLDIIVSNLHVNNILAPATYFLLEDKLSKTISHFNISPNTAWEKAKHDINRLRNRVYFIFLEYLPKMKDPMESGDKEVILRITYKYKPVIRLIEIMSKLAPYSPPPKQIHTSTGSFIEWISCTENIVKCVELFLQLIGDIAIPFVILHLENNSRQGTQKQHQNNKDDDNNSNNSLAIVADRETGLPLILSDPPTPQLGRSVSNTIKIISEIQILDDKNRFGYSSNNIKEIRVIYRD